MHLGVEDKRSFTRFLKQFASGSFALVIVLALMEFSLALGYRNIPESSFVAFGAMVVFMVLVLAGYGRTMMRVGSR